MNVEKEIQQINNAIAELVYEKTALQKAYNYYHGIRDAEQFKYLETNHGLGTPTGVGFNPLVRPHIDRLIGEYLGLNQELKITCKDKETVSNILREKQLKIASDTFSYLKQYIENNIVSAILEDKESVYDPFIVSEINKIKSNIEDSFVSSYEIAAQNILDYLKQSKYIDLDNKTHSIFTDLCISGTGYYRTKPTLNKENIQLEVLNPLDTFIEKNPNSIYLADSRRAVIRKYMSIEDILAEYHEYLKPEHLKILKDTQASYLKNDSAVYVHATSDKLKCAWDSQHPNILGGLEVHPTWHGEGRFNNHTYNNLITVYEVEWIEVDYKTGKQTRHEGVKIGPEIYITKGESEFIVRSKDDSNKCRLTVNGLFLLDKNGNPNSLIINTMPLQDRYDLLVFYRDNLIASSGTVGDWIDLAYVPQVLGAELPERLQKWLAYKKQGLGIIDSSQEGAQMMNTIFNGFDDTIKAQAIQAIELAMQSIQKQVSMVTGVLPEALAQYEQRDAVSNVQLGVRTTMLLTKQYFKAMDTIYKEMNYDMLNLAKIVWKDGLTGTLVLGNYAKIFTILPEHYTITDFDIHIEDSTRCYQHMQSLSAISGELIKAGAADLSDITNIVTATSMTELKRNIDRSIAKKKEENDMLKQMEQQLQQTEQAAKDLEKQNKQLTDQIQQLQKEVERNNQYKLQLEAEKIAIEKERMQNDRDYNNKMLEAKQQQLQVQLAETVDGNPWNNKIKSVV